MGLLSGLIGLASDVDPRALQADLAPILLPGEEIELAFQIVRDLVVFTDLRLVLVDKQGMSGRKRQYQSIPYRSITMFSVETAGTFDADAEMALWISGQTQPFRHAIGRGSNVSGIQKALAQGVLGRR